MLHSAKMSGRVSKESAIKEKAKDDREAASEALERAEVKKRKEAENKAWDMTT